MVKGIGNWHIKWREEKKEQVFQFIKTNQPITYAEILKNGHFRRNTIPNYVQELESDERIVKIQDYYYIIPIPLEIKEKEKKEKMTSFFKLSIDNYKNLSFVSIKMLKASKEQPIRFSLAMKRVKLPENKHRHRWIPIKGNSDLKKCSCMRIKYKEKILEPDTNQSLEQIPVKGLINLYTYLSKNYLTQQTIEFLENTVKQFKLYPRIEFPRYKDIYENPHGIRPKYCRKDGSINYEKIEKEYQYSLFLGTLHSFCKKCGKQYQFYVADWFNFHFHLIKELQSGKITKKKFKEMSKHAPEIKIMEKPVKNPYPRY